MNKSHDYPKVSVIIPVYNTEKYLTKCLESVIKQTYKNIEIIAVDDGSEDNSFGILNEYSKKDSRIKVFQNEVNRGVSHTLNHALKHSTGQIIARMDSDNIMVIDRIEKQVAFLMDNPECIVVGGQETYIDEDDKIIGGTRFPLSDTEIKKKFFSFQPIADPASMYNLSKIPPEVFYFDESLTVAEGLDLYFRLFKYGKFANIEDSIILYRQRQNSLISTDIKRTFKFISIVRKRAKKQYGIRPPFMAGIINFCQKIITSILPIWVAVKINDIIKKLTVRV